MTRRAVPLDKAYRLVNHGPVTLVSAAHDKRENVMAVAWCMALDLRPPKLAIVLAQDSFTRALVDQSRELVVHVPPRAMIDVVDGIGTCSGRDVDKWARFGLQRMPASIVRAPLIEGCLAWLECRVIDEPAIAQSYDLFVLDVVAAWADDDVFDHGRWRDDAEEARRSFHHVAGGSYVVDGARVSVKR